MSKIVFEILKFAIFIMVLVAVRYIIPWIKENTDIAKNQIVMDIVTAAVQYAEQTITDAGSGAEKKAIVTDFLRRQLEEKNLALSMEQLDALIESAVYAMNVAKQQ